MVTVSEETADYELTAQIATDAFDTARVHFSPDRIKWLYERSFGRGTTVLAAIDDGRKIGQIALVGQAVCVDGEICPAIHSRIHLLQRMTKPPSTEMDWPVT